MADIGFKASKSGQDVTTQLGKNLKFSSSFFIDKVMGIAIGVNLPHGLGYKPTVLGSDKIGDRSYLTYVDNYQVNIANSNSKAIVLSQQGT